MNLTPKSSEERSRRVRWLPHYHSLGAAGPTRAIAISERKCLHLCAATPARVFLALAFHTHWSPCLECVPCALQSSSSPPCPLQHHFFQEALPDHVIRSPCFDLPLSDSLPPSWSPLLLVTLTCFCGLPARLLHRTVSALLTGALLLPRQEAGMRKGQ